MKTHRIFNCIVLFNLCKVPIVRNLLCYEGGLRTLDITRTNTKQLSVSLCKYWPQMRTKSKTRDAKIFTCSNCAKQAFVIFQTTNPFPNNSRLIFRLTLSLPPTLCDDIIYIHIYILKPWWRKGQLPNRILMIERN